MSYSYRGRYTHNRAEYARWVAEGEAEEQRRLCSALQGEATRLRSELSETQRALSQSEGNVREAARLQAQLEERQRDLQTILGRLADRQVHYEQRSEQRQRALEEEIVEAEQRSRSNVEAAERRAQGEIAETRRAMEQSTAAMRSQIAEVQRHVDAGLREVRTAVETTRRELEAQVSAVRADLAAERERRIAQETTRARQARALSSFIRDRAAKLLNLDALGLSIERTRILTQLDRMEEILMGDDPSSALPIGHAAFTTLVTAQLESERRTGVIDGVAEHVNEIAASLEQIAADESFRLVFQRQASQIDTAVAELRARAEDWRRRLLWTRFEAERDVVLSQSSELLACAVELAGVTPALVEQLQERDRKLKDVAEIVAAVRGSVDRFEDGFADEDDVKSPRLLRAYIGRARIDSYLELDGVFRINAYGFSTSAQCDHAAARMSVKLNERWQVLEHAIDRTNPQQPQIASSAAPEAWQALSSSVSRIAGSLGVGSEGGS